MNIKDGDSLPKWRKSKWITGSENPENGKKQKKRNPHKNAGVVVVVV